MDIKIGGPDNSHPDFLYDSHCLELGGGGPLKWSSNSLVHTTPCHDLPLLRLGSLAIWHIFDAVFF